VSVTVTDHAIKRYQERIEPCADEDAIDRLAHAVEIARPASAVMVSRFKSKLPDLRAVKYLHCTVENLFIVAMPDSDGGWHVLTVFRAEAKVRLKA
jgi:hypothetical protein